MANQERFSNSDDWAEALSKEDAIKELKLSMAESQKLASIIADIGERVSLDDVDIDVSVLKSAFSVSGKKGDKGNKEKHDGIQNRNDFNSVNGRMDRGDTTI